MRLSSILLLLAACGGSATSPLEAQETASLPDDAQVPPPAGISCLDILTQTPGSPSGVYSIQPSPMYPAVNVFCDMTTDGGGWTMVSSSNIPPTDRAVVYSRNIGTVNPRSLMDGIWVGMNNAITGGASDIRFVCRRTNGPLAVDLSFYNNGWYSELTSSPDEAQVCFEENNGLGQTEPPARRNNRNGDTRAAGDQWDAAGYFEGEDFCNDAFDFTVDFDDQGMDGNETDGTDWGRDDREMKCGANTVQAGQANWFVLVREVPAAPVDTAVDSGAVVQ